MTDHIDGKAVERWKADLAWGRMARDDQKGDWVRYSDYEALLAERDALQAQVDAYKAMLRQTEDDLSAALARECAVAAAAWIAGRDAAGATFGAHAMLIANVQPPTDAAAALARREDDVWNEAIEAAATYLDGFAPFNRIEGMPSEIRALKRSRAGGGR